MLLLLKLLLVPALLLATSLAGRRFGPRVAGRLAGLPVVVGPILFVLTLEHGDAFGAQAAVAALAGLAGVVLFSVTYSRTCVGRAGVLAWPAAVAAWLLVMTVLSRWSPAWPGALVLALLALVLAPRLFPAAAPAGSLAPLGRVDLALRMVMGAVLTLAITAVSSDVGPAWSGLVTTFPVMTSVLAVSSHRAHGPAFTVSLLRGMVQGLVGFGAFCLTLVLLLPASGRAVAFPCAVLAALASQLLVRGTAKALWRGLALSR